MSWWISLNKEDAPVSVTSHEEGGTYQVGGCEFADVNVTYNYGKHFDFKSLHNRKAKDTIREITDKIKSLKNDVDKNDYWNPTEGNVKKALGLLLTWAKDNPDAVWRVN